MYVVVVGSIGVGKRVPKTEGTCSLGTMSCLCHCVGCSSAIPSLSAMLLSIHPGSPSRLLNLAHFPGPSPAPLSAQPPALPHAASPPPPPPDFTS